MSIDFNDPEIALKLTSKQRLILIGYSLPAEDLGAAPKGENELEKEGSNWLNSVILKLKGKWTSFCLTDNNFREQKTLKI